MVQLPPSRRVPLHRAKSGEVPILVIMDSWSHATEGRADLASSRSLPSTTVQMVPSGSRWWSRWAWPKRKTVTQLSLGVRSLSFHTLYEVPELLCFTDLSTRTPAVAHRPGKSWRRSGMRAKRRSANLSSSTMDATTRLRMRRPLNFSTVSTRACCLRSASRALLSRARSLSTVANARMATIGPGGANNRVFRLGRDDRGGRKDQHGRTRDSHDAGGALRTGCESRRAPRARSPRDAVCARATRDRATTVRRDLKSQKTGARYSRQRWWRSYPLSVAEFVRVSARGGHFSPREGRPRADRAVPSSSR